jgi:hypothetical protein
MPKVVMATVLSPFLSMQIMYPFSLLTFWPERKVTGVRFLIAAFWTTALRLSLAWGW